MRRAATQMPALVPHLVLLLQCATSSLAGHSLPPETAAAAAVYSNLSAFEIGASGIHGRGMLAKHPLKKGAYTGIHWFDYKQPRPGLVRPSPGPDGYALAFFPPGCNFPAAARAEMESEELLGCFPRLVNHHCEPTGRLVRQKLPRGWRPRPDPAALAVPPTATNLRAYSIMALRDLAAGDDSRGR